MIADPRYNDPKGAAGAKKVPLGLIPAAAMTQTAWVHKLGANKYGLAIPVDSASIEDTLNQYCTCEYCTRSQSVTPNAHTQPEECATSATPKDAPRLNGQPATQTALAGPRVFASPAMTSISENGTPSMPSASTTPLTTGLLTIRNTLPERLPSTTDSQPLKKGTPADLDLLTYPATGLTLTTSSESLPSKMGVLSATGSQTVATTSTTIMPLGSSEGSCATAATKDLACSEILSRLLKAHSPTCGVQKFFLSGQNLSRSGEFNWRITGVCASTYVNAILRHLNAWREGEDNDPESGITHLAHVACCCNILMDAAHCGTLQDDRNKVPQNKS